MAGPTELLYDLWQAVRVGLGISILRVKVPTNVKEW